MPSAKGSLDYDRAGFWVGVCALFLSVVLIYINIQSDWRIAKESGSLRKPQLVFGLGRLPLDPSVKTRILFGARKISREKVVVVAGIPFSILNSGSATLENATITYRFHEMFGRDRLEALKFTSVGGFQATQIQRFFTVGGQLHYSSYLIPALNPGQTVDGTEQVYLPPTTADVTMPAETADKKAITVSMSFEFALEFLTSIAAKDMLARDYPITLETAEAVSLDDLTQRVATTRINQHVREAREEATFGQYLKALVFGVPDEQLYLVFAELDEHPAGDGMLYFARPQPKVRRVSYNPVSWRQLLK